MKTLAALAVGAWWMLLAAPAWSADADPLPTLDAILASLAPGQERVVLGDARYQVSALRRWRDQLAQASNKGAESPQPLVTLNPFNAWTGGIVYYSFDAGVSTEKRRYFLDAAAEWATYANLQFIARTAQPNYTVVSEDAGLGGGLSDVGMVGGMQEIKFGPNAWNRGTILHEIGHTLGLLHEHQRPDRDTYVTILTANIQAGAAGNFTLLGSALTHSTAYDFRSIMHYGKDTFSISPNTLNTIEPKPAYASFLDEMGSPQRHLSAGDKAGIASLYGAGPALSSVVTNTKDSGPGSLRQCINYALDNPGTTVTFNIPSSDPGYSGVWTIKPSGMLPALKGSMVIDGATQTTNQGNTNPNGPEIVLHGADVSPSDSRDGFWITGAGATVRGLVIQRFAWNGVHLEGSGATNNKVEGCYIGTNSAGAAAEPNGIEGVYLENGAHHNTIGGVTASARNVISGGPYRGILIEGSGTNSNLVQGNYIGTNASGAAALGNGFSGVEISLGAQSNVIGGTAGGARNVISGNSFQGILIRDSGTDSNSVQGNYIGLSAVGGAPLGNGWSGVEIGPAAKSNIVGGTAAGAGNVISGNGNHGVLIRGSGSNLNRVEGNRLGTDPGGAADLGNTWAGAAIAEGAQSNVIGGTAVGAGNVISGNNNQGVLIQDSGTNLNLVQGNYIGTDVSGTSDLGNGWSGVEIASSAQSNTVGGTASTARNVISGNDNNGLLIQGGAQSNGAQGNFLGLNAAGTGAIGNAWRGVVLAGGATLNTVGGAALGGRNFISGNELEGIAIFDGATTGNVIAANTVGRDVTGAPLGNARSGILLYLGVQGNTIGGATSATANLISRNQGSGVVLYPTTGVNRIVGNRIFDNDQSGGGWQEIDLMDPGNFIGVTPNDMDDPDAGPNDYQNFPVLTSASLGVSGSPPVVGLLVSGSLNSVPSLQYQVQFFASATGPRDAEYFLGSSTVTTDGDGDVAFSNLALPAAPVGWRITATATSVLAGGTSELSASLLVTAADTDGDGMPNAYESGNGLNPAVNEANLDLDGDGWTNIQEMMLGTNPLAYSPGLDPFPSASGGDIAISFPTVSGKIYQLQASHTLGSGAVWIPLADGIFGLGAPQVLIDSQAASLPRRFYRLFQTP